MLVSGCGWRALPPCVAIPKMTVQRRFLTSPFGRPGQMCPVAAPTRCLECRIAFILPSSLLQLLLFAARLEQLGHRLARRHFMPCGGRARPISPRFSALRISAGISRARQRIADCPRRRFALSDFAAVHATVESGTVVGEVVIDVS
ncbi:hypothetical protein ACIGCZ_35535 [Streptomyces nigra]|uniref:hypothetical protein n=1 Tax=Streptomyces nigra TaxID=1827580 RepID=UPI0037D37641